PVHSSKGVRVNHDGISAPAAGRYADPPPRAARPRSRLFGASLVMLAVVVTAATVGVLLPATAAQAFAKPLTDWSFYMRPVGTGEASTLGCNQGQFDAANGNIDSEVVLDFGGQAANGQGTLLAKGNNEFISYAAIEATAEAYAASYFNCTGSDVTSVVYLNLGTNNSAYFVNAAGGAAWAKVVNDVQAWVDANAGQVIVQAADDI